jgi:hypothetical protein
LALALVAAYAGTLLAQSRAAENLCQRYPAGTAVPHPEDLEGTFLLSPMGEFSSRRTGPQEVIFCASMTLCDDACAIVIEDGFVTSATRSRR